RFSRDWSSDVCSSDLAGVRYSIIGAARSPWSSAAGETLGEVALDLVQRDPLLGHGVALADRHRVVHEGVEVDGDAVGRADLVLADRKRRVWGWAASNR